MLKGFARNVGSLHKHIPTKNNSAWHTTPSPKKTTVSLSSLLLCPGPRTWSRIPQMHCQLSTQSFGSRPVQEVGPTGRIGLHFRNIMVTTSCQNATAAATHTLTIDHDGVQFQRSPCSKDLAFACRCLFHPETTKKTCTLKQPAFLPTSIGQLTGHNVPGPYGSLGAYSTPHVL